MRRTVSYSIINREEIKMVRYYFQVLFLILHSSSAQLIQGQLYKNLWYFEYFFYIKISIFIGCINSDGIYIFCVLNCLLFGSCPNSQTSSSTSTTTNSTTTSKISCLDSPCDDIENTVCKNYSDTFYCECIEGYLPIRSDSENGCRGKSIEIESIELDCNFL